MKNVALVTTLCAGLAVLTIAVANAQEPPPAVCAAPPEMRELMSQIQAQALKGDMVAQAALGSACLLVRDGPAAVRWLRPAAEQGSARAAALLGEVYGSGLGVPRDPAEAAKWNRRGAAGGDGYAQYALGLMYIEGRGVEKDPDEGYAWVQKAANRTCPPSGPGEVGQDPSCGRAQLLLAEAHMNGDLPEDYVQAYVWADLAVVSSIAEEQSRAARLRERAGNNLTAAELAQAMARSRAWKPAAARP